MLRRASSFVRIVLSAALFGAPSLAAAQDAATVQLANVQLVRTPGAAVTLTSCGGSATSGSVTIDLGFTITGTKAADAVELLLVNDSGPLLTVVQRIRGTFAPGAANRQTVQASTATDVAPYAAKANHCLISAVHFADGTLWQAAGTFPALEHPATLRKLALNPKDGPRAAAVASDGSLWVLEEAANRIVHVDRDGARIIGEVAIPTADANARFIARGAGGTIWFTEFRTAKIGVIDASGAVREYPVPCTGCHPAVIVAGLDGSMWFSEANFDLDRTGPAPAIRWGPDIVGKIGSDGRVDQYPIPTPKSFVASLVVVPDGTVWFVESGGKIGHLAADGKVLVELDVAGAASPAVPGRDSPNALKLSWIGRNQLGTLRFIGTEGASRIAVGSVTGEAYPYKTHMVSWEPGGRVAPFGAAFDARGNVWIADAAYSRLLRYGSEGWNGSLDLGRTASGASVVPADLVAGDDGSLWVVETVTGRVVHVMPR